MRAMIGAARVRRPRDVRRPGGEQLGAQCVEGLALTKQS
jgi:hypothetical protein